MKSFDEFQKTLAEEKALAENAVRYEALEAMKQIQATISSVSLLNVLGVMRPDNPLRKNILDMEAQLHDLNSNLGQFIADNIADVETEEGSASDAEEEPEEPEEEEVEPEEEKPEKKEKKEKKPTKKDKKDEEPSEPEVKGDAPKEQDKQKEEE